MSVSVVDKVRSIAGNPPNGGDGSVAGALGPLLTTMLGNPVPVRFEFWDASGIGPAEGPGTVRLCSVEALRRMVWAPGELGVARAYIAGDLEVDGDLFAMMALLRQALAVRAGWWHLVPEAIATARRLGALGHPVPPPVEEASVRGRRHSLRRDATAVRHHYDVGNEFYRLILGPALTYSCARFTDPEMTLAQAQGAKHELICRKLGLHERPGGRLLDVGCGWGSLALHAARHYDVSVLGITLSVPQAELARQRVAETGLADRIEIRVQDYRDLAAECFDAVSSVGMSEHVGASRIAEYFEILRAVLAPGGRLVNHAISSVGGSSLGGPRSFITRYVFPDGELLDVAATVGAMEAAGFEVRDVESLREHYATTLRAWVANLEGNWERAAAVAGAARARIWRLYMVSSALAFEANRISIHQVLGVVPDSTGASGMPATRRSWD